MKRFWVSWWNEPRFSGFCLHAPWWVSGSDMDGRESICAAIQAPDEDGAADVVSDCYDVRPDDIELRFVEERPDDWTPYSGRFRRADWMHDLKHWSD